MDDVAITEHAELRRDLRDELYSDWTIPMPSRVKQIRQGMHIRGWDLTGPEGDAYAAMLDAFEHGEAIGPAILADLVLSHLQSAGWRFVRRPLSDTEAMKARQHAVRVASVDNHAGEPIEVFGVKLIPAVRAIRRELRRPSVVGAQKDPAFQLYAALRIEGWMFARGRHTNPVEDLRKALEMFSGDVVPDLATAVMVYLLENGWDMEMEADVVY